ncbi:MAG: class I SAM-dependent methyltransferase [Gammaproteobacteria bacterium]|nr:class I SAM-dependent methyltransferase [Gammaproteobacteria bacterium]
MDGADENGKRVIEKAKRGFEAALFAENYDQIHSDAKHLAALLMLCEFVEGKHYLDLGTGNGYVAFEMAKQSPNVFVTGIDIVVKAIESNNQKARTEQFHNLSFSEYRGMALPFEDRKFLSVLSRYAFHHFPDPLFSAKEIHRVIEDGGFCIIADAVPDGIDSVDFINRFAGLKDDGHVRFYSKEEIESIFEKAGFRVEEQTTSSITFPRRLTTEYRQLVEQMPQKILEAYRMVIEENLIYLTVGVLNTRFRRSKFVR